MRRQRGQCVAAGGGPFLQLLDERTGSDLAAELDGCAFPPAGPVQLRRPRRLAVLIRSGEVEVFFKDDTGERIVLETAKAGDVFGELSLLDGGPRTASVVATQDLEALRVDRADLDHFLQRHPAATLDLLAAMGRRLRATSEKLRHTAANVERGDRGQAHKVQKTRNGSRSAAAASPSELPSCLHGGIVANTEAARRPVSIFPSAATSVSSGLFLSSSCC